MSEEGQEVACSQEAVFRKHGVSSTHQISVAELKVHITSKILLHLTAQFHMLSTELAHTGVAKVLYLCNSGPLSNDRNAHIPLTPRDEKLTLSITLPHHHISNADTPSNASVSLRVPTLDLSAERSPLLLYI